MAKVNRIVKILMERDDISESEANAIVQDARSELLDAIYGGSVLTPEEVMYDELGLEPDYIFDLI